MNGGKKWKLLIVEDHALLRTGLRGLLEQEQDLEVIGESDNGRDAANLVGKLEPHIVLMDLSMPRSNGIDAIVEIKRRFPGVKVLVLTQHKADEYIHAALKAGANGYILKTTVYTELLNAVRAVIGGKSYLTQEISTEVIAGLVGDKGRQTSGPSMDSLTLRERQVLQLVAEGRSSKYIANYLSVSVKTIDKHRTNLRRKLGFRNASGLVSFAIAMGVIPGYRVPNSDQASPSS